MQNLKGRSQTVLGPIDPKGLGVTLMHEHLYVDTSKFWEKPTDPRHADLGRQPVRMGTLGWIRINPFKNYDNMILSDEKIICREVLEFKAVGGGTIVDLTPPDVGRDATGLMRVARL